jgi:Zn-dependent peptidase ImmA (M78 family)
MSIQSARKQAELLIATLGITQPPINIEGVAKHLGLRIISMDLEEGVSGLLITKPSMSCIAIREADPPARQRFSIAHEIAHFCLRHQFEPGEHVHVDRGHLISQRNRQSSTGTNLKEVEANQFAACLLMPAALVRASIEELGTEELYDGHITSLAEKFKVSEQAMTIRLSVLGLLS